MSASTGPFREAELLTSREYRTLGLSALGGTLEFYDFIAFVFFVTVVSNAFFPPELPEWLRQFQAFGVFAAGYLARPFGGIVMAHFGDRFGRKRMFTLSIFLMAVSTLGMGLLPTYATIGIWAPLGLLALRMLQGCAIGGEIPNAWVFVSEHVPENRIGLACGVLTAGLTGGILLGSLVATAINTAFAPDEIAAYAWRIPFLIGGVLGFVAVYLRRWLEETPVFQEMRRRKALSAELPVKAVVRRHFGSVIVSILLTWLLSAGIVVVILMTPTILQTLHHFEATTALTASSIATLTLSIGCVFSGVLIDRIGASRFFIAGPLFMAATTYAFYALLPSHPDALYWLYGLAGLGIGVVGAVPYVMIKAFPAPVRLSGVSFSFNVAYAIAGGLTPMAVSYLLTRSALAPAWYVIAACAVGLLIGLWLPARGRSRPVEIVAAR